MPPFLGDFGAAGGAGSGTEAPGATAEAENKLDDQNRDRRQSHGQPHLTEGEIKAGDINAEQGRDADLCGMQSEVS